MRNCGKWRSAKRWAFPHACPGSAAPAGTGRSGQHYPKRRGICDRHHQKGRGGYLCDPFFLLKGLCARWGKPRRGCRKTAGQRWKKIFYLSGISRQQGGHAQKLTELDDQFHDIYVKHAQAKNVEHQLRDFHEYVVRMRKAEPFRQ